MDQAEGVAAVSVTAAGEGPGWWSVWEQIVGLLHRAFLVESSFLLGRADPHFRAAVVAAGIEGRRSLV